MGLSHCDVERMFICHYQMGRGGVWGWEPKWNLLWASMRAKAMHLWGKKKRNVIRGAGLSAAGGMPGHVC